MSQVPIEHPCCPKCGENLSFEFTSKLMDSSRMSFSLSPHKGEYLSAKNVGKSIDAMAEILIAVGKELGVKTNVVISGLSFNEGEIKIDLLLTRHESGITKRAKNALHETRKGE
jgi:hypothetical protein